MNVLGETTEGEEAGKEGDSLWLKAKVDCLTDKKTGLKEFLLWKRRWLNAMAIASRAINCLVHVYYDLYRYECTC